MNLTGCQESNLSPLVCLTVQPVDVTTLNALYVELQKSWLPARLEQVYQVDRETLLLGLRTLEQRGWLAISWHPQAARLCLTPPPPRAPDTFTFSQQLRHQVGGLVLTEITPIAPWERALDLQFAQRPGEIATWHLYVEIMGNYSNVVLVNASKTVIAAARQISPQKSSVRSILTGQPYEYPPALMDPIPSLAETFERWRERVSLIPAPLKRVLLKSYRGLSSALVLAMVQAAKLSPEQSSETLCDADWHRLFHYWRVWLEAIETKQFQPGWTATGYTVLGWGMTQSVESVHTLVDIYYRSQLEQQQFAQLHHQLQQIVNQLLAKLHQKAERFQGRLQQSDHADEYRQQADLLMAHLHQWQPGLQTLTLPDFTTGAPIKIALEPEKNAVQNAQLLYKRHQKLKRARSAIEPLLSEVKTEQLYLEQIGAALADLAITPTGDDFLALEELRQELVQQGYLEASERDHPRGSQLDDITSQPYRFVTPNGLEILVGRNNRQNDLLTFRLATAYDLWFHTQEIAGSHVLLRLQPGHSPEPTDLQWAANLAAYFSRGRQSAQVAVVYTEPKYVFKPRGAKPGMIVYREEQVIWGHPQDGAALEPALSNQ